MSTSFTQSEKTSKFFSQSPYGSFSFILNGLCGAALLLADIWMIVKHWNSLSQDLLTGMAFWIGLIAIVGPFINYARTYSELFVQCQGMMDLKDPAARKLSDVIRVAENALDGQMLQYYAVVFTILLCVTKVFAHS
jgi:hypothetical protein